MKEKELKKEVADTLEIVSKHIRESKFDYDLEDLEGLLDQAVAYYALYLKRKAKFEAFDKIEFASTRTSKDIGEGVRANLRDYLDER
tara:strand:+ start:1154 stop:1414 length:261 start_codon:yes stop_codon:yes gene_type:complete